MKKEKNVTAEILAVKANAPGFFSIRWKLSIFLMLVALLLSCAGAYGLYGVLSISRASKSIIEINSSLEQVIKETLLAKLEGRIAFDEALGVKDFSQIGEMREKEAVLENSILLFNMYTTAITLGSESEEFFKSDGGLNFSKWKSLGLAHELKVKRPSAEQVQLTGLADIYFSEFASNALKSIVSHKTFLRLSAEGDGKSAEDARTVSEEYEKKALRFSGLAIKELSRIVNLSNIAVSESAQGIENTQNSVTKGIFAIFFGSLLISLLVGIVFVREVISKPLQSLVYITERINKGDLDYRAKVNSNDEISMITKAFNNMADTLSGQRIKLEMEVKARTEKLTEVNDRLQELLRESYVSAKTLVQKDRDLSKANSELVLINKELDEVGKILVRRDLELTSANERLEELDTIKSEFVSIAAHQLRTPLTGIKWTLNSLVNEELGRINMQQKNIIRDAYKTTEELSVLIDNLLNVARIEERRISFAFKNQPLNALIGKAVNGFKNSAESKGISLLVRIVKPEVLVNIDEEKMRIVLDNLLDNAIKYTSPGGRVSIRVSREKNKARVEIKDTGIGIEKSHHHRVFSKFFRSDAAQLLQTNGSGLGLYLVKNLIEKHGGTISFESEEGKGSIFYFYLPLAETKSAV